MGSPVLAGAQGRQERVLVSGFLVISSPTWVCRLKAIPEHVTDTEAGNLDHLTMPHPSVCHPSAYQSSQTVELMELHVSPAVPALLPLCPLGSDLRIYDTFLSKTHPLPMGFILRVSEMRKDPEPLIQWRPCVAFWYPNSWRKVYLRQECKAHELHRFHFSPFQWGQNYGLETEVWSIPWFRGHKNISEMHWGEEWK